MSKSILKIFYSCSVQKAAPKSTKYSRNESILKIGHHAKAIAHAKSSLCLKNYNSKKHVKIQSTNHLQLFSAKNRSKKQQIFQKWEHFENRPSCKGYSPCKILTLPQKLQFQKTCQNPFYKSFTVVLCKKPLQKKPNIREMRAFWKSAIMQRLSPMQNPLFASKITIPKNMSKSILQIIYSCSLQKTASKNTNIKTCQNPFYKSFTVVLCKKPLKKTPNIPEMRAFWKSAIMQRL